MKGDTRDNNRKSELDGFFDAARAAEPALPGDLMARILADADAEMTRPNRTGKVSQPYWKQILSVLGGWPAAAGLVATACAGLWIGYSPPAALETALGIYDEVALSDLGAFDLLLVEG